MDFQLVSPYPPSGDQPEAIKKLTSRMKSGERDSVLLGVTGSGKTFTVANVIQNLQRPTLVISHNKTLAAQLYSEFKQFFPKNAVEYFVSYFDYYQPEAYIPSTDTYIEKESDINQEIERMRLSATASLLTRKDVIVVASVSCIYGLGSPEDYANMIFALVKGEKMSRQHFLERLVSIQYDRNDIELQRGKFRVRGDIVEVHLATEEDYGLRIEFWGDEIERISLFDILTGDVVEEKERIIVYPAKHFVTPHDKLMRAIGAISTELDLRVDELEKVNKLLEAQRIRMRTNFDLDMLREMGFCSGIENYSRHLTGRPAGSRPYTLLDFFPKDYLTVVDESHVSIPQIGGMYAGDRSRKTVLVEHGFRLPSAMDNRPLNFPEFEEMMNQMLYVSATPGPYELKKVNGDVVQQVIRPTGLLDPKLSIRPLKGQIDELMNEAVKRVERKERVIVTTLTKRTAEDLADYLKEAGIKAQYLHSELDAIERVEILRDLRAGEFDVLIGINLLREGIDLPEVSLVAVLDADKEGFLRSETSLIQIAGRAARHVNGEVILFADNMTKSLQKLVEVTNARREKQIEYNRANNIIPRSTTRSVQESLQNALTSSKRKANVKIEENQDVAVVISQLEDEMWEASEKLEYEKAALLRDQIRELKERFMGEKDSHPEKPKAPVSYRKAKKK